ncbi:MAG: YbaN family protein [Thermoanaerobaculia bacterium]
MNRVVRALYVVLGLLCVGLGVLGMVLPLVPTTPLLLLAAFFFARSSDRFYGWLLANRWFGRTIRDYRDGRGLTLRDKVVTIAVLWLTVGPSVVFLLPVWWGRALMLAIATGVTIHLWRLPTAPVERR